MARMISMLWSGVKLSHPLLKVLQLGVTDPSSIEIKM